MIKDIISDLITRIRNANNAKQHIVEVPSTKIIQSIIQILKEQGYINDFTLVNEVKKKSIIILLKYIGTEKKSVINSVTRVSKPGRRIYLSSNNVPNVLGKLGIGIISTSEGVMTTKEAQNLKIGGEFLFKIY
jgi:small subunit ribosomal protein S8